MTHVRAPGAFLFDLDGTLVDTVGTRVDAWMEAFPQFGIHPQRDFLPALMGSDGKLLARTVAERFSVPLAPGVDAEIDRVAGERFGALNRRPRPLPGAIEILAYLDHMHVPWAIATSSRPDEAVASVASLRRGVHPLVIDGSDVAHAKPAPDLLLKGASQLALDPERVWYVGDSRWDMLAAVAAGMAAIAVTTGATPHDELVAAGATAAFDSLGQLLASIKRDGVVRGK